MEKKAAKLKNKFSGDIVFCNDMDDIVQTDDYIFLKVFKEENPKRIFLVNRNAFQIAK
jgi:hypothetical protein